MAVPESPEYRYDDLSALYLNCTLKRLDFRPVLGEPTPYALTSRQRDGQDRATRAVALQRNAGVRVDTDAVFNSSLVPDAGPAPGPAPLGEPDVAFAEHPRLGIVAAIDSRASGLIGLALLDHGWRHDPRLDVYTLPAATGREEALGKVAGATLALHRSGVQVRSAAPPRPGRSGPATAPHPRRPRPATDRAVVFIAAAARQSQPSRPLRGRRRSPGRTHL